MRELASVRHTSKRLSISTSSFSVTFAEQAGSRIYTLMCELLSRVSWEAAA